MQKNLFYIIEKIQKYRKCPALKLKAKKVAKKRLTRLETGLISGGDAGAPAVGRSRLVLEFQKKAEIETQFCFSVCFSYMRLSASQQKAGLSLRQKFQSLANALFKNSLAIVSIKVARGKIAQIIPTIIFDI